MKLYRLYLCYKICCCNIYFSGELRNDFFLTIFTSYKSASLYTLYVLLLGKRTLYITHYVDYLWNKVLSTRSYVAASLKISTNDELISFPKINGQVYFLSLLVVNSITHGRLESEPVAGYIQQVFFTKESVCFPLRKIPVIFFFSNPQIYLIITA